MMNFFKTKIAKHRSFNYVPRYYDERKERLQAILDRDTSVDGMKSRIASANSRARFRRRGLTNRQATRAMFIRVLLIILGLLVITYLLVSLYLPVLVRFLE